MTDSVPWGRLPGTLTNFTSWMSHKSMRRFLVVLLLCTLACACVTHPAAPETFELTWAKPHVAFETFVADVDACNATAEAAGRAVQPRRGAPENDLSPPILAWRWLAHGADVDEAMAGAYSSCFGPRGYSLVYVSEAEAQAFRSIGAHLLAAESQLERRSSPMREEQLHLLHQIATAAHLARARIDMRQQRRPLVSYVAAQ